MGQATPADSQILIPAVAKARADWASINRLARENGDFLDYVRKARTFLQTDHLDKTAWFVPKTSNDE